MSLISKKILLIFLFTFSILSASEVADSLLTRIENSKGLDLIEARLDYAYYMRRNNADISKEQSIIALNSIRENYDDKDLEAKALYYIALPIYYTHKYEEALVYFQESLNISKITNNLFLQSEIYFFLATTHYYFYSDVDLAIRYYNLSISQGQKCGNYRILGASYSMFSNIYRRGGSYEKSLEFAYKSKNNYELSGFKEGLAWSAYTMGSLYYTVDLLDDAKRLFSEALDEYRTISKTNDNITGIAICLDQLTMLTSEMGNYDQAEKYNNESISLYKKQNLRSGMSTALRLKSGLEYHKGHYDEALSLLDSSFSIKREISDFIGFSKVYEEIGRTLIALKEYKSAKDTLTKGLEYAKTHKQTNTIIGIYAQLANLYKLNGEYSASLYFKTQEANIADSIHSAKLTKGMMELESLYEIESRETMIRHLEDENNQKEESLKRELTIRRLLTLVLFSALIILALFIYFFREKQKINHALALSKKHVDEVNATKDKFFSIIAHDLKAPFSSILGLTNILIEKEDSMDDKKRKEVIRAIKQSTKLSYELLNNLLEWSRTQTNSIPFHAENLNIDSLLESIKELMANNLANKNIELKINKLGSTVYADMNMLHTIFRNLVSNAIKYSKQNSIIEIEYKLDNTQTTFSVKDHGIGISPSNLTRLFKVDDPFYSEGTEGEKGTGLGLIITKEFIEKHNGKIWIESVPEKGSTFLFSIPKK